MRVYLIGMPGAGKSTIGRELAKELKLDFYDLDGLVEKNALMFIDELIEKYGEKKFRELEHETLKSLNVDSGIIACGGGIVLNRENKKYMDGIIINLDVNNSTLEARLKNDYDRPLLKEKTIDDLYNERFLMYQHFSSLNISNNASIEETIMNIKEALIKL